MTNKKYPEQVIKVDGEEIRYHRIDNDMNGNPRYVVHFLSLGIEPADYGYIPGIKKYRAKWFGGGVVIQSYSLADDLRWHIQHVKEFYSKQIEKSQKEMIQLRQEHLRKEAPWILS